MNKTNGFKDLLLAAFVVIIGASMPLQAQTKSPSNVDNFENHLLKVNLADYPMTGKYRFLKISDDANNVLFLGQAMPDKEFLFPVSQNKVMKKIVVEIFTESSEDATIFLNLATQKEK